MNIELYMLDRLKTRVQLARQIDVAQHKANKEKHEKNWLRETADAMEIELDSDFADRCAHLCLACHPVFEQSTVMRKAGRTARLSVSKRPPTRRLRISDFS